MPTDELKFDVSSKTYSNPVVVAAGPDSHDHPTFFTVVNSAGLTKMMSDGHFGDMYEDGRYGRIREAFGMGDTVTTEAGTKDRLLIVESQKIDGKTIPVRVHSAEVVTTDAQPALHITETLNLRDGLPKQTDISLDNVSLDSNGRLGEKGAAELRQILNDADGRLAAADAMGAALAKANDPAYQPSTPDGYATAASVPAGKRAAGQNLA